MTRKQHTIIVVPHARARFRQFQVTSRLLWSVATAVSLSLLLGVVFGVLWLQSVRKNREVTSLVAENQDLRGRTKSLNAKLESLEKVLAEFEERTRRLSIVAGLSGSPDPGTGGVGGLTALPADDVRHTEAVLEEASRRGLLLSGRLGEVESRLSFQADQLALTPTLAPALGVLTAGFGLRSDPFTGRPDFHAGIDISSPKGSRIVAPASGTVVRVGWDRGYGRVVEIAHGFGVRTLFAHLEAPRVTEGQRVRRGDLVGLVGSTGRSTGPHLHYEVQVAGKPVNPLDYVLNAF
ncbi:MAG: peptidoglycan DD-metalloendopeptidase family protein [Thermoanaerobaculia bacterium]|nr:peptidoglycan DD-metalloendopeptidase family protein [Thermoanaerobaculia bacterium]